MYIKYTDYFHKRYKKKLSKNQSLKKKVSKQIKLLLYNPTYPSLKVHKLSGKRKDQHSLWIEKNIRITFKVKDDYYLFTDIITHDEY